MTQAETVARYIHQWQALDGGHGKYTERCICNHHARGIVAVLDPPEPPPAAAALSVEALAEALHKAKVACITMLGVPPHKHRKCGSPDHDRDAAYVLAALGAAGEAT